VQRREFLSSSLAAGAGALLLSGASGADEAPAGAVNVALIGAGIHGRTLANCLLAIGGVRICAVCDVWEYRRTAALNYLEAFDQQAVGYEDYREMLDNVKGLNAVVVATPDFVHAEQTIACLNAGLHVYCEAPMAPTLAAAQAMAGAAGKTGNLLQVGYQRRSSPRYRHVEEKLLQEADLIEDITAASAQWNQSELGELGWPRRHAIPDANLERFGYASMHEFRNWRWFRRYSAGPFATAAVHQIDVLNRLLGAPPRTVLAAGGADFFPDRECQDNLTAIFEYPVEGRTIRAICQVHTTTHGTTGSHELLVGTAGSIRTSENRKWERVFREPSAFPWDEWTRKGYLAKVPWTPAAEEKPSEPAPDSDLVQVAETGIVEEYEMPLKPGKSSLHYHLENFLDAIRGRGKLTCPAEVALASEGATLRAIEAVDAQRLLPI
jgi:predicted dehydrogenase